MTYLDCNKCGKKRFHTVDARWNVVRVFTKNQDYSYFFCNKCLRDLKKEMDMISEELKLSDLKGKVNTNKSSNE